jgi:hypothetical protein
MRIAYQVPGATCTAHTPVPAHDGRGAGPWANTSSVNGQPGTQGIPTGLPDFGDAGLTVNGLSVRGGGGGYAHGSGTMPKVWYPQLYYLRRLDGFTLGNPGQGPSVYSDNQMPVPAADPTGRAAVLAQPALFLADSEVNAGARPAPRWPGWAAIAAKTGYTGPGSLGG